MVDQVLIAVAGMVLAVALVGVARTLPGASDAARGAALRWLAVGAVGALLLLAAAGGGWPILDVALVLGVLAVAGVFGGEPGRTNGGSAP